MISFGNETPCDECGADLTGRQRKYCGSACKMRAVRRAQREAQPAEKTCRLCGATFRPLRGKATYCDYLNDASPECSELQNALRQQRTATEDARWDATCAREGCDNNAGWDGTGRPRRFCSEAHKKAHYRAVKRAQGA